MNRPVVTIKDVARQAGISVTTVSRALNNHDDVAEVTRTRVQEIARTLNYHPNMAARNLQGNHAGAVGLVIPLVLHRSYDAFWLDFIGGMAATCASSGVDLLVSSADTATALVDGAGPGLQRIVRGRRVDGLLICDIRQRDPRISYLQRERLPFVAFGRTIGTQDYSFIDVDGASGILLAMEHLFGLGHRRIAYLGVAMDFSFSHYRFAGYLEALQSAGLPYNPAMVHHDMTEDTVSQALATLLAQAEPPTAIVASADFLGLALIKSARGLGVTIPEDLSIVVFDDSLLVQHAEPPLTSIRQPNHRMGEEATQILLQHIASPGHLLVHRLIVPDLITRGSTTRPPVACHPE